MQKVRKFRYVQRLIPANNLEGDLAELRFGQVLLMDYMGSVEFERGAFADFLKRMHTLNNPVDQRSLWQRRVMHHPAPVSQLRFFRATVAGVPIYAAYDTTRNTQEQVVEEITSIAKGRTLLKAPAYFPLTDRDRARNDFPTAWAEIKENVIWSLNDLSYLGDWLNNSITFMAQDQLQNAQSE